VSATPAAAAEAKQAVGDFWEQGSCGEVYAEGADERERFEAQARARYALEPFIFPFARFEAGQGKDVLEIGVGMGADHVEWARRGPRSLAGIDLTRRAVDFTRRRLALYGLTSDVRTGDAECLPFADASFDVVYSWGVLHHSPNTQRAVDEVRRVLRPGGRAAVMVYHRPALVGKVLWARYALARGRPRTSLDEIYARYLESPGTRAYTREGARQLFRGFAQVETSVELSSGDLMEGEAGQRHRGPLLAVARRFWPRPLIRRFGKELGLFLLIDAVR
jgi:ubiquinone/menaquinone biosynthesis C-methylase UbiE